MIMISEFVNGTKVHGQFLVNSQTKGVTTAKDGALGKPYMNVELKDSSGTIMGKLWTVNSGDEEIFAQGNVVLVEGEVYEYRDSLQMKIIKGEIVPQDEINVSRFVKAPPIPRETLIETFNSYVSSITNNDCRKLLKHFIEKFSPRLYDVSAGVSVHHEYASGLLVHITTMAKIGEYLSAIYDCNRDILLTGIILHDIGKTIELEGTCITKYSFEGKMLGHINIMVAEIRKAADELGIDHETAILLEHMVLSHHGEPEFGSPIAPLTKEAILLNLIDNLDSKMVIANKALEGTSEGEFSTKVYPLNGRCLYKPTK